MLDVNDAEARALLLAIDPLAQLAGYDDQVLTRLREQTEKESAAIQSLWRTLAEAERKNRDRLGRQVAEEGRERFFVLVQCEDESEQTELLRRFQEEGLKCEAKMG